MEQIEIINYLEKLRPLSKKELENFIWDYESCLKNTLYNTLYDPSNSTEPFKNFQEKWKYNFGKMDFMLKDLFLKYSPKQVYALIDLCN